MELVSDASVDAVRGRTIKTAHKLYPQGGTRLAQLEELSLSAHKLPFGRLAIGSLLSLAKYRRFKLAILFIMFL